MSPPAAKYKPTTKELKSTIEGLRGHIRLICQDLKMWESGKYVSRGAYKKGYSDGEADMKRKIKRMAMSFFLGSYAAFARDIEEIS